ncbi:PrsW family intramembrane metalloprotease [Mycolicibacterium flavescens]|nr:PrsW family intramembrane metalloprotease [Mycolicibacterium flavescens]
MATVVGLIIVGLTALNPVGTAIGFVLSSVAMLVVALAYIWLDRWEPEPPRLLLFAFLWGASVAVVLSVIVGLFVESLIVAGESDEVSWVSVAVAAPVIEEAAKGAFLLLMMTGRRRNELNSLTDCLVYAGLVGAGFAWLEDILYISSGESLSDSLMTAALRLIMAPFAHSLFTTFFAIGVYFAMQRRGQAARAVHIALGYLAAVVMHGLWNGSSLLGVDWYLGIYVLWMMPIFALAIGLGVYSRRREQKIVTAKLPGMLEAGLVTPNEATWLGSLRGRKAALAYASRLGGPTGRKAVKRFAAQVVELAFVRDRIDRGFGDPRVHALLTEEAYAVHAARAAGPTLQAMAGYRAAGR